MKNDLVEGGLQFWRRWERRFMPEYVWDSDPLTFWRERILFSLVFSSSVLGPFVLIPSLMLAFIEERWDIIVLDNAAYLTVLLVLWGHRLSFKVRAWSICLMLYVLGVGLMFILGPTGAGYIWLFGASVMVAAILGVAAALASMVFNLLALVAVGFFIVYGAPAWPLPMENILEKWVVMSVNFLLINALVAMTTAFLLNGLNRALSKEVEAGFKLRRSEKRFRTLVESAPLGIASIDQTGRILDVNSKLVELIGAPGREALLSINVFRSDRLAPSQFPQQLLACLKKGQPGGYEAPFSSSWKKALYLRYLISPLLDSGGEIDAALVIIEDISKERIRDEQLRRAQKMESLGLLAGGVAHDLNNVLSGIVSYPELLLLDLPDDSPLRNPLKTIQESGRQAAEIVQDLLALARRGVVNLEVLSLNRMVTAYLHSPEFQQLKSHHPTVEVETRLDDRLIGVAGSPVHIKKTIMNLVSNAAEAQPEGGRIVVRTENRYVDRPIEGYVRIQEGDYAVLCVEDKGIGIAPEDLKRIFEPFFTKKVMGRSGTGLGMAVVWATVQDHNGCIDVQSVEGQGTLFELYFPATREQPAGTREAMPMEAYRGSGETILVVDDVENQRMIATQILERLNYRLAAVSGGEEAVRYVQRHAVDLVLLDMVMDPGIDGLETYRRIIACVSGQKAVIASGFAETARVKEAIELGASRYIKKPYTIENIGMAVKQALQEGVSPSGAGI